MGSFTIRDAERHSVIDSDLVDKKIKDRFHLDDIDYRGNEDNYCHFYFTEPSDSISSPKSVSWADLLHKIIYYSDIKYGPATTYDIESAASYVRLYSIHFPKSGSKFISKVLQSFKEWGYYIFVENNYNNKQTTCYYDDDKRFFFIKTGLGICRCNEPGVLIEFIPSLSPWDFNKNDWPEEISKVSDNLLLNIQKENSHLPHRVIDWINYGIKEIASKETKCIHNEHSCEHPFTNESVSGLKYVPDIECADLSQSDDVPDERLKQNNNTKRSANAVAGRLLDLLKHSFKI